MLTLVGPVQDVPKYKMKRKFAEGSRQSLGRVRRRDQEGPVAECTSLPSHSHQKGGDQVDDALSPRSWGHRWNRDWEGMLCCGVGMRGLILVS